MKKVIALVMVCGFAVAFLACGGGQKAEAEKAKADSTRVADSLAKVAVEAAAFQAKADSTAKADSIAAAAAATKK
jgi:hypothetical protein